MNHPLFVMSKNSSIFRFYFLVGAYGISFGFLLISAFVGLKYLRTGSWVFSNEYLTWIFGFGIVGLLLFIATLVVTVQWRRADLVIRPEMPDEQYKLLLISIGSGVILMTSLLTGILTVGFSAGSFGVCTFVPLTILLWFVAAVRFGFSFRDGTAKSASLPLLVNSAFICLVILLYWTNSRIDFGFRWRLDGYEEVVRMVENGELMPNDAGFATLPEDYQWLSDGGEIVILHREDFTSVVFYTQIDFPGEYYAIAYRSDDSIPQNFNADRCDRGWRIQADIPNWFVCVSTRFETD